MRYYKSMAETLKDMANEGKYSQYSSLLVQKGKLLAKGLEPNSTRLKLVDKEIEKEKKKLGIKEGFTDQEQSFLQTGAIMGDAETNINKLVKNKKELEKVMKYWNKSGAGGNTTGRKLIKSISSKIAKIKEETELDEIPSSMIKRLQKEYEPLRGKSTGIAPEKFAKLRKLLRRFTKPDLLDLVKADLPIVTTGAKAVLVVHHGMKWSQLPEELVPYVDELSEGTKFGSVDDKVMKRIELMMKGSREMKNSIANLLNYLMPPEVVDMVKDKLNIKMPRGKIKF